MTNALDDIMDFETKMYHFLDPPRSPGIVPSPEGRRGANGDDVDNDDNTPLTATSFGIAPAAARFFADEDDETPQSTSSGRCSSKWFCVQCNRSFAAQFALDQHRRFKHQGYKIHCRHCPHTTTNGYALYLHVQREHSDISSATNGYTGVNGIRAASKRAAASVQRKRRAYKVARHTSSSSSSSRRNGGHHHARAPANDDVVIVSEQRRAANSGTRQTNGGRRIGGKPIGKRTAMKIVRQAGIPPLACDKCGKKFAFSSGLRMHTKMVHSGYRFTCQYCGLHFTNGYAIHRHVNVVHNVIGAVRNSCYIPGTETPEGDDEAVANFTPSTESKIVDTSINEEESLDHLRLRLKRKALSSDKKSSVSPNTADEWSTEQEREFVDQKYACSSSTVTATPCRIQPLIFSTNSKSKPSISTAAQNQQQRPTPTLIRCLSCPFKTENLETLKIHFMKHTNNMVSESSSSSSSWPNNLRVNRNSYRNQCPYCTYVAEHVSAYVVHAASHFLTSMPNLHTPKSATLDDISRSTSLRCTYCERHFSSADELDDHERKHSVRF